MNLFINVYLTEELFLNKGNFARQNAKYSDKVDVFKYMLASLQNFYPWTKVIINYELDNYYLPRFDELENFIQKTFQNYPLVVKHKRNLYQEAWADDYDVFEDDLILFLGNHDHIFIDPDPSYFREVVDIFRNYEGFLSVQFSHWPEVASAAFYNLFGSVSNVEFYGKFFTFEERNAAAIQVINKKTYYCWWNQHFLENKPYARPDGVGTPGLDIYSWFPRSKNVITYREIARHFDAYQHTPWYDFTNDKSCVLEIPDNFFNDGIKINYSTIYREGYVNINPLANKTRIYSDSGPDLNICKELIPHFWKDKIIEFKNDFNNEFIFSKKELFEASINNIMNIWSNTPNYNSENGKILKSKIKKCHYDLLK